MGSGENKSLDYYLKPNKFIRDHAHEYVFITDFELSLVDTIEFQRLKDVRQLTCQHVYPGARHTRFEHSLGVTELMRRAIDALNFNGYISNRPFESIDNQLKFNGTLAALLHDVGHCPFSHPGEREFDRDDVWQKLYTDIEERLPGTSIQQQLKPLDIRESEGKQSLTEKELKKLRQKYPGAIHEQLSCCVILENLYDRLAQVKSDSEQQIYVDFELICRCILGLEYDTSLDVYTSSQDDFHNNQKKNIIVHLINSRVFDMDKLDYIIRDSHMTGIGAQSLTPTACSKTCISTMTPLSCFPTVRCPPFKIWWTRGTSCICTCTITMLSFSQTSCIRIYSDVWRTTPGISILCCWPSSKKCFPMTQTDSWRKTFCLWMMRLQILGVFRKAICFLRERSCRKADQMVI